MWYLSPSQHFYGCDLDCVKIAFVVTAGSCICKPACPKAGKLTATVKQQISNEHECLHISKSSAWWDWWFLIKKQFQRVHPCLTALSCISSLVACLLSLISHLSEQLLWEGVLLWRLCWDRQACSVVCPYLFTYFYVICIAPASSNRMLL